MLNVLPFPAIDPVLVEIGPFAIRWYALAYVVGILIGWRYARGLAARGESPLTPATPPSALAATLARSSRMRLSMRVSPIPSEGSYRLRGSRGAPRRAGQAPHLLLQGICRRSYLPSKTSHEP